MTAPPFEITIGASPDAPQRMVREHTNARPELVIDSQTAALPVIQGPEPDRLSRFERRWGPDGERAQSRIAAAEDAARTARADSTRLAAELAQARAGNIAGAHASIAQRETDLKARREHLVANLEKATEAADSKEQARLQADLADVAAQQGILAEHKRGLPPIPEVPKVIAPQPVRYTQRTQAWVDDNPWFNDPADPRSATARGIAGMIEREGKKPDTDEYFAEMNKRLAAAGAIDPQGDDVMDAPRRPTTGAPSATPSRAAYGVEQDRTGAFRIRPTPEEQETARMLQLTDEQYAAGKVAAITGKLIRHTDENGRAVLVRSHGKPAPVVAKYDQFKTSQGVKSASRGD